MRFSEDCFMVMDEVFAVINGSPVAPTFPTYFLSTIRFIRRFAIKFRARLYQTSDCPWGRFRLLASREIVEGFA
jgi:hypothetical protein